MARSVSEVWYRLCEQSVTGSDSLCFRDVFLGKEVPCDSGEFNEALERILKRTGRKVKHLDLGTAVHYPGVQQVTEATFSLIGKYCLKPLRSISFRNIHLRNQDLVSLCEAVKLDHLEVLDLAGSFAHYCAIGYGIERLLGTAINVRYLNMSKSIDVRFPCTSEGWPGSLKEVYLDNCRCLTGASLLAMITACQSTLTYISLIGSLEGGLSQSDMTNTIVKKVKKLRTLRLTPDTGDSTEDTQTHRECWNDFQTRRHSVPSFAFR